MGDINSTGVTVRKGSEWNVFTYDTTAPGTSAVATPISINASALYPAYYEATIQVVTASGGTSPTVGLGATTSGTDLIGLTTSTSTAFLPANNAVAKGVATDLTTFYIREGGTPNGAGAYRVIVQAGGLNLNPVN